MVFNRFLCVLDRHAHPFEERFRRPHCERYLSPLFFGEDRGVAFVPSAIQENQDEA